MNAPVTREAEMQPPLLPRRGGELSVALGGLALGGAERIVLDWAARLQPERQVHVIALRDHDLEWPEPAGVRITRLHGRDVLPRLGQLGREIARSANPVCLCHLLTGAERTALARGGAFTVPVLHNARAGWCEEPAALDGAPLVIAVSAACAAELRQGGFRGGEVSVIHHLPAVPRAAPGAREHWRALWRIPPAATVLGMVGGIKPQKDYPAALRLLHRLHERRDAHLVIVGGPIGRDGRAAWNALLGEMERLGLRRRLALPGFVPAAARCLPAFDVLLNTSRYEGLSMATLEALASGLPVVASRVGGQGEIAHAALTLVDRDAPSGDWVTAIEEALARGVRPPRWASFPAHRLWTLASLARPFRATRRVLFVTANLNAGGAQRSLVNLARALARRGWRRRCEIVVAGSSTAAEFQEELRAARVTVHRSAAGRDPFAHAEALIERICARRAGTVCFWNLDAKVKLLLVKALAWSGVRFVDACPGGAAFDEMRAAADFQRRICFDQERYYARLDRLVLKYHGPFPREVAAERVTVIPNGVPRVAGRGRRAEPAGGARDLIARGGRSTARRIVVSGRIAPAKHLLEIVAAMRLLWLSLPDAELHIFGAAEPRHLDYARALETAAAAAGEAGGRLLFHGPCFGLPGRLAEFDAAVVLGSGQGCPNSLLEAMAAGLPVVANDDGGSAELVIDQRTGLLLASPEPAALAAALLRILGDERLARTLGKAARAHVRRAFGMAAMARGYARLFHGTAARRAPAEGMPESLHRPWPGLGLAGEPMGEEATR
jgi:glycosyltransferase involved in cell wall biosynthesis